MSENAGIKILICQGTGGVSMGAKEVEAEFHRVIRRKGCECYQSASAAMLSRPVAAVFAPMTFWLTSSPLNRDGSPTTLFKPEEVEKIIEEHIVANTTMEKRKAKPYYNQFVERPDACCHDRLWSD